MFTMKTRLVAHALCFAVVAADLNKTYVRVERHLQNDAIKFPSGFIVGGTEATPRSWFVHFGDGNCGGSLISADRVLTAAHCVSGGVPRTVRVGATTQSDGTEVDVECAKTHPDYNGFVENDLAIIKLRDRVSEVPVALNTNSGSPTTGENLTVIGMGRTSTGGSVSSRLLQIEQNVVDTGSCDASYGGGGNIDSDVHICALASNVGPCNGDSGGPLFNTALQQVGIVSFGSSAGCSAGIPDGYTRVSNYASWIQEQLNDDSCDGFDLFGCVGDFFSFITGGIFGK